MVKGKALTEAFPLSKARPLKDGDKLYLPTLIVVQEQGNKVYLQDIGANEITYYIIPKWFGEKLARMSVNPQAPSKYVRIVRGLKTIGGKTITTINAVYCTVDGEAINPNA